MDVIKCSNCENEILDTDIVCPYCDHPVRGTSEKPSEEKRAESHISDQTMKVTVNRDSLKNKEEKKETLSLWLRVIIVDTVTVRY